MKMKLVFPLLLCLALGGCITDSQNTYSEADVGRETSVEYGTVVAMKSVTIQGRDTGAGVLLGAGAGGGLGNAIASGPARAGGAVAGVIVGALAGGLAEHALQKQPGIQYTIIKHDGRTVQIVQTVAKYDAPIHRGQHVIIQSSGHYMRVLPADDVPDEIRRPKEPKVED